MREVKQTHDKHNAQGFEVIIINFSPPPAFANEAAKRNRLPWPQVFHGSTPGRAPWREYGIDQPPAFWLLDKKGILRDYEAKNDLLEKVEKLLAEPSGL